MEQETEAALPEEKCITHKKPRNQSSCIEISCEHSDNMEDNTINTEAVAKKELTKNVVNKDQSSAVTKKLPVLRNTKNLPRYRWKIGHWNKCSVNCGPGLQKRVVSCYDRVRGQTEEDQRKCSRVRPKPKDKQACNSRNCPIGKWLEGEWSACSASCGKVNQSTRKSFKMRKLFRESGGEL